MENVLSTADELQLLEARQKTEFALSPIGQMVTQMEAINKVAQMYAKSDLVPATFKGKPENCSVAINMAIRMKTDPVMLMQNMYVVHGNPSLSSKMIIAMVNSCGQFEPLRWEQNGKTGEDFGMRAWTFRKDDVKHEFRLESSWVTMKVVAAEGWGAKWKTMPEQMFRYRTAVFWARTHAPEVTMGFMSKEEVDEPSFVVAEDVTNQKSLEDLARERVLKQKEQKAEAPVEDFKLEPEEHEVKPAKSLE